jgi:hypothetical protein
MLRSGPATSEMRRFRLFAWITPIGSFAMRADFDATTGQQRRKPFTPLSASGRPNGRRSIHLGASTPPPGFLVTDSLGFLLMTITSQLRKVPSCDFFFNTILQAPPL